MGKQMTIDEKNVILADKEKKANNLSFTFFVFFERILRVTVLVVIGHFQSPAIADDKIVNYATFFLLMP